MEKENYQPTTKKTEDQPIVNITIIDKKNFTHNFLAKSIPASNSLAYLLVDEKGNPKDKSTKFVKDKHVYLINFDGLWIENEIATSLVILTKEREIHLGKVKEIKPFIIK